MWGSLDQSVAALERRPRQGLPDIEEAALIQEATPAASAAYACQASLTPTSRMLSSDRARAMSLREPLTSSRILFAASSLA